MQVMQKEVTVKEFEDIVNTTDDIEPMIVKREDKKDLLVISLEEYLREKVLRDLEESERQVKEGKVRPAEEVFRELREKYGY